MVYGVPAIGEAIGPPPNQFLTVSDPGEPLGGALVFKGTLSGAGTALPSSPVLYDAWAVGTPVPTAIPRYQGITPDRAAVVGDAIYWTGTAWKNIGSTPRQLRAVHPGAAMTGVFTTFFREQLFASLDKTAPLRLEHQPDGGQERALGVLPYPRRLHRHPGPSLHRHQDDR